LRILFVVPYAPTVIRTRPYNFLRALARLGHELTLATLWQDDAERAALHELEGTGIAVRAYRLSRARTVRNSLGALPGSAPLQAAYAWQPALAADTRVLAHASRCDVVHVEHLRGVRYALALRSQAPTVWDSVDCISHLFAQARVQTRSARARFMTGLELGRTRRYEGWLVRQFDRILVASAADKEALDRLAADKEALDRLAADKEALDRLAAGSRDPAATYTALPAASPIAVLHNGVDLEAFRPLPDGRRPDSLVLSGKMAYHANVTAVLYFVHEILPLIWRERPQTKLWLVGQSPPAAVKNLAADPRIMVTGQVSEMCPYLAGAAVAVCPLVYGAGIQNKVLEAMACATPVVSAPASLNALGAQAEGEALAGAAPQEFAQQVLRLLRDPQLACRIGEAGRRFVERHHSWEAVALRLTEHYDEVINLWQSRRSRQPGTDRQRSTS
jgi:polysaccharide biosynthesis protein PslH